MPQMLTLATIGTLSVAGALAGVQLGRSAVAEIDPFFFTPQPETRFFADLVPAGYDPASSPATRVPDVGETWAGNLNVSGRAECFDCGNFIESPTGASGPHAIVSAADLDTRYVSPPTHMPSDVERYAYFPITQEEAARPPRAEYADETDQPGASAEEEPELLSM